MYLVYRALLLIANVGVLIYCQRGGYVINSCTTDECRKSTVIVLVIALSGSVGLVVLLWATVLCCERCKGQKWQPNFVFNVSTNPNSSKQKTFDAKSFQTGIWSSRYFHYGKWHGPYRSKLSFNHQLMEVVGSGSDDVGTFSIDGTFSSQTQRMGLTKTYEVGTGNPSENLGHQVIIQLTWNAERAQFEGKWHVQTVKYHGEDKFELRFDEQNELPTCKEDGLLADQIL